MRTLSVTRFRSTAAGSAIACGALVSLLLTGCGDSADATSDERATGLPPALQELYDAAVEEGAVTYWTSDDPPVIAEVMKAFSEEYPGIRVEPVLIQPEEAVEKVVSESASGRSPSADVVMVGVPSAIPLIERDLLEQVDWTTYGVPEDDIMFDGGGVRFLNYTLSVGYNPEMIDRADVPTTIEGLIDSPLLNEGKLVLESRGWAFGLMAESVGQDASLAMLDGLLAKDPLIIKGAGPVGQTIASGEAHVGFTLLTSSAMEMNAAGASVDYVPLNPVLCTNFQNVVLKGAEHSNAAKLLTLWLTSPAAMDAFQGQNLFPERLSGDWIPDYSQVMLDDGAPIICDSDDHVELAGDTNTQAAERMAGLG